jgi:perosamine synthetase
MLAIHGGQKLITGEFKKYNSLGTEEILAVNRVMGSGILSGFLGSPGKQFLGGENVLEFEERAARFFGSNYCVSFNSWTSGLTCAVGSIPDLQPGDEVITTPWTMSATAMAILHFNAIPVFADIDPVTYCLDPLKIEELITPRTKAILTVDIFGKASDYVAIRKICDRYGLFLISDSAQAPGAKFEGQFVTKLADIGGYSLNYHKHIQCGEGGFALTDSKESAERMRLIRNHAESVVQNNTDLSLGNMIGHNYRMGEMEAAIASEQLKKLEKLVAGRINAASYLIHRLNKFPYLDLPVVDDSKSNVFYFLPIRYTPQENVSREKLYEALVGEGIPGLQRKYTNIHRLPIFTTLQAYGNHNFPWSLAAEGSTKTYGEGKCPNAEKLYDFEFLGIHMCSYEFTKEELDLVISAFHKVWFELFGVDVPVK